MINWNWKRGIALGLSAFVLFTTATSLTGCEFPGAEIEEREGGYDEEEEDDD
ncbi:hypothetical protein Sta7437_3184 [Stanieria cyanosphaera PCC 7437]|uniref:Lipoprotein n=1 Tax=Stanieria cyanosphaera (strain ATCC 29371 / PCC 7437) TaxID=111780 RepID=K9XYE5_STAC7|nr:hypothetical protein [Stanieria cyanosphaera]AFZ36692.1 hypothetical protein Sta7437_3184 [Stanieria cyanosphaera PCC 7437]